MGTIKVITIARNHIKQKAFFNHFNDILFEFVVDMDMTVKYTDCHYVSDLPNDVFDFYDLDKDYCSRWSKGQFGCFATEKKIIRDFYFSGKGNLTIFLDDAIPSKNWQDRLKNAYAELPNEWDALILGTHLQKEKYRVLRPLINIKRKLQNIIFKKSIPSVRKFSKHLDFAREEVAGIYGIIYSQRGVSKLILEPERLRKDQDDVLLSRLVKSRYLDVYISYPQVVREGKYDESWTQKNDFTIKL
jgi:hypothetical protein